MQPVTTRPGTVLALVVEREDRVDRLLRASSMNAHVLTTTRSAADGIVGRDHAVGEEVPISLSESTWFLGQPSVST
jgi:hypothetical protein